MRLGGTKHGTRRETMRGRWVVLLLALLGISLPTFAQTSRPANPANTGKPPAVNKAQPPAVSKADKERKAALVKAKSAALPVWQELVGRYSTKDKDGKLTPTSPRCEEALYNIGVLHYEMAEAAPDDRSEQMFKDAALTLKRFCELYPKSRYAGRAYLLQTDVALEHTFDLKLATTLAASGADWAKQGDGQREPTDAMLPPWNSRQTLSGDKDLSHELFLRAGMTALLSQNYQKAVEFLKLAGPEPESHSMVPAKRLTGFGVTFLLNAATQRRSFTKEQALAAAGNEQQKTLIMLADLYLWGLRAEKARSLYQRVVDSDPVLGRVSTDLEAYAIFEIAATYNCERTGYDAAIQSLAKLNERKYKATHWQPYAKFRTALYTVNKTGDLKKSLDLYQAVIDEYPDHPITELASAYYCMNACVVKDKDRAVKASKAFYDKYPSSGWKPSIEKKLQELMKESGQ